MSTKGKEVIFVGPKTSDLRYLEIIRRILSEKGEIILKGGYPHILRMIDLSRQFAEKFTAEFKLEEYQKGKVTRKGIGCYIKLVNPKSTKK